MYRCDEAVELTVSTTRAIGTSSCRNLVMPLPTEKRAYSVCVKSNVISRVYKHTITDHVQQHTWLRRQFSWIRRRSWGRCQVLQWPSLTIHPYTENEFVAYITFFWFWFGYILDSFFFSTAIRIKITQLLADKVHSRRALVEQYSSRPLANTIDIDQ